MIVYNVNIKIESIEIIEENKGEVVANVMQFILCSHIKVEYYGPHCLNMISYGFKCQSSISNID